MGIAERLTAEWVLPNLRAATRDEALEKLVRHAAEQEDAIDADAALRVLVERERQGSTGISAGIALPHAKLAPLRELHLCLGVSPDGVPFGAQDGQDTNIFFLILAPERAHGAHLNALARASRLLSRPEVRTELLKHHADPEALAATILRHDQNLS